MAGGVPERLAFLTVLASTFSATVCATPPIRNPRATDAAARASVTTPEL